MSISTVSVGGKVKASTVNALIAVANLSVGRVQSTSFNTDLNSSTTTEVVGYSQAVSLTAGTVYRVNFNGLMNGGAGIIGGVRIRYATGAVTTASTQAGGTQQFVHSAAGSAGRGTLDFSVEFTAPTTGSYNIAVGVLAFSGASNETIVGSSSPTTVTVDKIGP